MKNNKKSPVKNKNIKGKIGSEGGYYIDNCPVLIPKENIKFFTAMQKACSVNPYGNYGNAYNKKLLYYKKEDISFSKLTYIFFLFYILIYN